MARDIHVVVHVLSGCFGLVPTFSILKGSSLSGISEKSMHSAAIVFWTNTLHMNHKHNLFQYDSYVMAKDGI